jgi:hypothetical protein
MTKALQRATIERTCKQISLVLVCQPYDEPRIICARRQETNKLERTLIIGVVLMLCKRLVQGVTVEGHMEAPIRSTETMFESGRTKKMKQERREKRDAKYFGK